MRCPSEIDVELSSEVEVGGVRAGQVFVDGRPLRMTVLPMYILRLKYLASMRQHYATKECTSIVIPVGKKKGRRREEEGKKKGRRRAAPPGSGRWSWSWPH
jgi:hypothetical protein